jgi:hypothetical protein
MPSVNTPNIETSPAGRYQPIDLLLVQEWTTPLSLRFSTVALLGHMAYRPLVLLGLLP